jgi:RecB family exonuclease/inactivated superfamily I helicase
MSRLPSYPEHLRIFPSRLAADRNVRLGPGDCVTLSGVTTFPALLESLATMGSGRYAPPLSCRVLLRELLVACDGWMAEAAHDVFAVRAVQRAVAEMREAGITAGHLNRHTLSPALADLTNLLARYESALASAGLADDADWQRRGVLGAAQGKLPAELEQVRRITVEGGAGLFGARIDLLAAMARRGVGVEVRLPWDAERPELFAWPEASLANLEARSDLDVAVTFDNRVGVGPLAGLRGAQLTSRVEAEAPVELICAPSFAEHGRLIAARVAGWLRRGIPADEVCVAVANLDDLGPAVVAALHQVGVAAYLRRGERLRDTPVGRALLAALRLPDRDFPREPFLEVWRTLGHNVVTARGCLSPAEVAARVRDAGIRSQALPGYREGLAAGARRYPHDEDRADEAAAIADALEALIEPMAAFPAEGMLAEQVAALEALLSALAVEAPELHSGDNSDLLRAQARGYAARDALGDVLVELRQTARTSPGSASWSQTELADLLTLLLSERRLPPRGMRTGSVAILGIEELVETRFSRVVLAGVDADAFPRAPAPDHVLTEDVRSEINRLLGPRLLQAAPTVGRGGLHGSARDLWLWLEALRSAEQELVVTFAMPEHGAAGGGRSELVDELHRSLGEPVVMPSSPACSLATHSWDDAIRRWSLTALAGSARLSAAATPGQSAALDAAVRQRTPDRVAALESRVHGERRIQSEHRLHSIRGVQREHLEHRFLHEIHSSSRLDLLGACRFRHFAAAILGLERSQVPTLGPDPREEGSAAHAALELVYRDLLRRGGLAAARAQPEEAVARARLVFDDGQEHILTEVTVHPLLRRATLEDAWAAVATQLERDLEATDAHEPLALEHTFNERPGTPAPPLEIPHPRGGRSLKVRGSIDRVDYADGDLITLDYKRTHRRRGTGRHFQLPVYGLAAHRDLASYAGTLSAAWVTLRDGKRHVAHGLEPEPSAFAAQLAEDLWSRVDPVLAGEVSPDPESAELCRACDFAALCRFDPHRAAAEAEVASSEAHR